VSARAQVTVSDVMLYARDHLLTERPELFMKGHSVCACSLCRVSGLHLQRACL
jgi:hypothetical protein